MPSASTWCSCARALNPVTAEALKAYVDEMAARAIADIEHHWHLIPQSLEARDEPAKYDWRHSIRYAIAKGAFEAVTRLGHAGNRQ